MKIARSHLEALQAFGYTEEEARFLYIVATHSGYFMARQFLAFTDAHWGKRTTLFWNKLQAKKHARTEHFPKSGVVYHLFARRLYRQISRENLRNRREHETEFVQRRIAMLDFVLTNLDAEYLETEPEKLTFFCDRLKIPSHVLPSRTYYGQKTSQPTVRYFVDKFPMLLSEPSSAGPVVTFTYIEGTAANLTDFVHHLDDYLPLFRQLPEFRFLYLARTDCHFAKATELFNGLVAIPLESNPAEDLVRYFRIRQAWDLRQYGSLVESDLIFRNQAQQRFSGNRFENLYRGWKAARVTEADIRQELGANDVQHSTHFQAQLLERLRGLGAKQASYR
jgi:hypothetical protein